MIKKLNCQTCHENVITHNKAYLYSKTQKRFFLKLESVASFVANPSQCNLTIRQSLPDQNGHNFKPN